MRRSLHLAKFGTILTPIVERQRSRKPSLTISRSTLAARYVTEKIVNAFLAGAIPIYWGSPFVLKMFNPRAFIFVNRLSGRLVASKVVMVRCGSCRLFLAALAFALSSRIGSYRLALRSFILWLSVWSGVV